MSNRLDYDNAIDNKFRAYINLGKDVVLTEELVIDESLIHLSGHLTYDDVEFAFDDVINRKYPSFSFPDAKLEKIEVFSNEDDVWVPVLAEHMVDEIKEITESNVHNRFLVLPDAVYSLTDEYKLWLNLIKNGIVDEDSEFDFDKMHNIIEFQKQ